MNADGILCESGPYGSQLVWPLKSQSQLVQFQLQLITRHKPQWLLPCHLRYRNGQAQLCLDTTDLKSMDVNFNGDKLNSERGRLILTELFSHLAAAADWLLPIEQFSLQPSAIFFDADQKIQLAFWPARDEDSTDNQLDLLLESIGQAFDMSSIVISQLIAIYRAEGLQSVSEHLSQRSLVPCNVKTSANHQRVDKSFRKLFARVKSSISAQFQQLNVWINSHAREQDIPLDHQTVLLTANPADFRMALLAEGKPGTPEENEGLRAFILIDEFTIGRDPKTCDLCLSDPGIGRQHARITRRAGSFFITDLGSRNGTRLDGIKLQKNVENLLPDQSLIQFADHSFYFQVD